MGHFITQTVELLGDLTLQVGQICDSLWPDGLQLGKVNDHLKETHVWCLTFKLYYIIMVTSSCNICIMAETASQFPHFGVPIVPTAGESEATLNS